VKAVLIALAAATTVLVAGCGTSTPASQSSGAPAAAGSSTGTGQPPASANTSPAPAPATSTGASTVAPTGTSAHPAPENPDVTRHSTRCRTAELAASIRQLDSSAGHRYAVLILTNISRRTCTVDGYGGIQLATGSRQPVPTLQRRDRMHPPSLVRLVPGGQASTLLSWGVVQTGREGMPCEPTASLLLVIPPDETVQLAVPWRSGAVCGFGAIAQWAYAAGIVNP